MLNRTKSQCRHPSIVNLLEFIKILRVEPFTFAMLFQYGLRGMPSFLMIQDKVCMQWYNTTYEYCRDLPSTQEDSSGPGLYKTRILADAIQMATYTTYVHLFPSLVYGLLIGAWIDRFNKGRKFLLIIFCLAGMMENVILICLTVKFDSTPYINVFMTIPTLILAGGYIGPRVAVTHYITATTPPKMIAIRFMIFEICMMLALPIGSALAGFIIVKPPTFLSGQTRNYTVIYIISFAIDVVCLLWVIVMVNERIAQQQQKVVEVQLQEQCKNDVANTPTSDIPDDRNVHPFKLLFNRENAKSMLRIVSKKRPNKGRKQILLAILSLSILFGEQIALGSINSQFIQRVYYWNPDYTAYMGAIGMLIASTATMTIVPIMTRILNVWDIPLAIVGFFVNLTANFIKGCWLSENAYYLAMAVGSIGGMASICTRSHIAKTVDRNEQGKMMAVMAIADTISPVIATTIFSQIFRVTVDKYPGTVFYVIAGLIFIPIFSMIWIFLRTERQTIDGVNNHETNEQQEINGETHIKDKSGQ
ncbi:solute carrier family 46 member 3-like [Bradysia coprophila]|uniref:solute carrier family 46 member 3-like n=1 Tax=Bradysia coprophila TaxID=38358 RepID=UPI00187DB935|nr:solute carrier family 46 member 3-like [Bradysia coprophila]